MSPFPVRSSIVAASAILLFAITCALQYCCRPLLPTTHWSTLSLTIAFSGMMHRNFYTGTSGWRYELVCETVAVQNNKIYISSNVLSPCSSRTKLMFYNITDSEESIIRKAIPLTPAAANNKNTLATQSTTAPPPDNQYAEPYFQLHLPHTHHDQNRAARPHSTSPPFPIVHASLASSPCRQSTAARSAPPQLAPHQRFHCYKVVNNYYLGNQQHTRVQPGRHTLSGALPFASKYPAALDDFTEAAFCANFDDDISCTEAASLSVIRRPASLLHALDFSRSSARSRQSGGRGLDAAALAECDTLGRDEALLQAMGQRSTHMSSKRSASVRKLGTAVEDDFWGRRKYAFDSSEKDWSRDERSWQVCLKESYWRQVFCCE